MKYFSYIKTSPLLYNYFSIYIKKMFVHLALAIPTLYLYSLVKQNWM